MNLALIIFAVSLAVSAFVLLNKSREVSKGKAWLSLGNPDLDEAVYDTTEFVIYILTHASVQRTKQLFRKALHSTERLVLKLFDRVSHRFAAVSDIVTGKDIPKNRGSVSFFLKNVEVGREKRKTVAK